jgi:hypothetical protein
MIENVGKSRESSNPPTWPLLLVIIVLAAIGLCWVYLGKPSNLQQIKGNVKMTPVENAEAE